MEHSLIEDYNTAIRYKSIKQRVKGVARAPVYVQLRPFQLMGTWQLKLSYAFVVGACIKNCPTGARVMADSMMKTIANGLSQYFSYPKEPRIFGIDV